MAEEQAFEAGAAAPPSPAAEGLPSDQQLVTDILRKDRKAAAQFVAQHADAIYGYVRHRLAPRVDLVDDTVQEVFLAALGSLSQFRGTSSLRAWLLGIARHKVEDHYRRALQAPEPLDEERADPPVDELPREEQLDLQRARAKTQDVLERLPDRYSLALLWRYWENRSVREIAGATGKTEKAIERTLARARARFRALWEQVEP